MRDQVTLLKAKGEKANCLGSHCPEQEHAIIGSDCSHLDGCHMRSNDNGNHELCKCVHNTLPKDHMEVYGHSTVYKECLTAAIVASPSFPIQTQHIKKGEEEWV